MKALTICQPYAELILLGDKPIENRRWATDHRGPLLIHAGKSRDWLDSWPDKLDGLVFGAIIGIVHLADCLPKNKLAGSRHAEVLKSVHCEGPVCWILENPIRFTKPIRFNGMPGLFDVPDALLPKMFRP